jgi:glycogen operon protein
VILNAYWEPLEFELPTTSEPDVWRRWIDTSRDSPDDIVAWEDAEPVSASHTYRAVPRSVVVLWRTLVTTDRPGHEAV